MKKILLGLASLVCVLSLASCNDGNDETHKFTYTNENGEEVEVEIAKTEDEEKIKDIIGYLNSKASSSEIKNASVSLNADMKANGTGENQTMNATLEASLNVISEKGISASGNIDFTLTDGADSITYDMGANLYYSIVSADYLYFDYYMNGTDLTENLSGKYKISTANLLLIIGQIINSGSVSTPVIPTAVSLPTETPNVSDIYDMLDLYLPNSKLAISAVTDNSLTMTFDVAIKDIANLSGNTTYTGSDVISVNAEFALDTALPLGIDLNVDMMTLLPAVDSTIDLPQTMKDCTISINMDFNYDETVTIDSVPAGEEGNYVEINPSDILPETDGNIGTIQH